MRLCVLDLETDPFRVGRKPEPFVSGFYDGSKFISIWDNDPIAVIDKTVLMLESEEPCICYWHNGGKFDVFSFMPYVRGNVKIVANRIVSCVIAGHEFRDSYAIMPFPLSAYKKDEMDYELMEVGKREANRETILTYLRGDCAYLWELVTTFHSEFGNRLTIGGSSMRQLKRFHSFATGDASYDIGLRDSFYFGGRNQCFETGLVYAPLSIYDVNSMYSHVMRSNLHPISTDYIESNELRDDTCFLTVRGVNRGAFPTRTKTGLDFTCPNGTFHVSIHEYRTALDTGSFEGEILETYNWRETSTFAGFVDHFFEERKRAKQTGDKARDLLYKFTLNSAYGKFAQNPDNFFDYQITSADVSLNEPCEHCHGFKRCRSVRPSCAMCKRMNNGVISLREIPLRFGRRVGLHFSLQLQLRLLLPFVGEEEEEFIPAVQNVRNHDGPAEGHSVLITIEHRARLVLLVAEEIVSVEVGIAHVVVRGPVQLIGSALAHNADNSTRVASILRAVGALDDAELFDGVGIGIDNNAVGE